jgi:uncharacterized 2Fe-2S/4Fe-4S cluster protein (DUF4445 family)
VKNPRNAQKIRVGLFPSGTKLIGSAGMTYAELLTQNGVDLQTDCGGGGTCGQCRLRFLDQAPRFTTGETEHFTASELAEGWRLACAHCIENGSKVEFSLGVGDLLTKGDSTIDIELTHLDPSLQMTQLHLPSFKSAGAHSRSALVCSLLEAPLSVAPAALRDLSGLPADGSTEIEAMIQDNVVIAVRSEGTGGKLAGLAIDIGTTTLAAYVYDLQTGQRVGGAVGRNPQGRYGADVISRIGYARAEGLKGVEAMHRSVIDGLAALIGQACVEAAITSDDLWQAVVVGNPTMLHLLLGISPVGIDHAPYTPVFEHAVEVPAQDIGLPLRRDALVCLLPAISAYVGADIVGGILATRLGQLPGPELLVDVGTNGEMVLAVDGRRIACSTAAGPALEGASISQGMYALPGAIDAVGFSQGILGCSTIGGKQAVGICGTGVLSAVSVLLQAGLIDRTGRLSPLGSPLDERLSGTGREARFRLTNESPHVFLSQGDIREFQLAKAAIRAGIDTLLSSASLDVADLERVLVAGALGVHLDVGAALRTGLLPLLPPEKVVAIGNSAGKGAALSLLDRHYRFEANAIAEQTQYLELGMAKAFSKLYLDRMAFPSSGQ